MRRWSSKVVDVERVLFDDVKKVDLVDEVRV